MMEFLNNPFILWLFTRVDDFKNVLSVVGILVAAIGLVAVIGGEASKGVYKDAEKPGNVIGEWETKKLKEALTTIKIGYIFLFCAFCFGFTSTVVPSQRDLLLIFGVPAALKTQTVQELQATMPDLAKLLHKQVTDALEESTK